MRWALIVLAGAVTVALAAVFGHGPNWPDSEAASRTAAVRSQPATSVAVCRPPANGPRASHDNSNLALMVVGRSLAAGTADPEGDAARAAQAGRFDMFIGLSLGASGPLGVTCAAPMTGRDGSRSLLLAPVFFSDAITIVSCAEQDAPSCHAPNCTDKAKCSHARCEIFDDPDACFLEEKLAVYAAAYNRRIVADPAFPYADICRPERPGDRLPISGDDPRTWSTPAASVARTRDLGEAARRGTRAEVDRWIAATPAGVIDKPDAFDMSPLAWAVVRNRADAVDRLLKAGADPAGDRCDTARIRRPVMLAIRSGATEAALRLLDDPRLTDLVARRQWIRAAAEGDQPEILARLLAQPHDDIDLSSLAAWSRYNHKDRVHRVFMAAGVKEPQRID